MRRKIKIGINYRPSIEELKKYHSQWNELKKYVEHEEALKFIFQEDPRFRQNVELNCIIIKCSSLNDFYSTNIYDIHAMAVNILGIENIDERLRSGDSSIIPEIAMLKVRKNDGKEHMINHYSFATKYCSHHQPDKFPIFDRYVEHVLKDLKIIYSGYLNYDERNLRNYENFRKAIDEVRDTFGLGEYSYKDIDRYIWQLGKEYYSTYQPSEI